MLLSECLIKLYLNHFCGNWEKNLTFCTLTFLFLTRWFFCICFVVLKDLVLRRILVMSSEQGHITYVTMYYQEAGCDTPEHLIGFKCRLTLMYYCHHIFLYKPLEKKIINYLPCRAESGRAGPGRPCAQLRPECIIPF